MKKLFALFLLVALVPFTVGCGLFGDNDDTSPITTSTLTLARLFPAGTLGGGSLRGATIAFNYNDLFMYITVNRAQIKLIYAGVTRKALGDEVKFSAPVLPSVIETINTNKSVVAEVLIQTSEMTTPVTVVPQATLPVTADLPTSGSTSPTALETAPITTIPSQNDFLKAVETANPTLGTVTPAFYEATVKYGTSDISKSITANPMTMIMLENGKYNFSATFNQDYANPDKPTFTFTVNHIKADGTVITSNTFKSTDTTSPITVSWSDKKTASIVVTPNSTYDLTRGEIYHITLSATDAYAMVNGVKVLPTLPSFFVKAH